MKKISKNSYLLAALLSFFVFVTAGILHAQEAPKPAAPAVMTPTGKTDADAWKEAMNILKRSDPGTFAMLTMGKYAGCDAGDLRKHQNSQQRSKKTLQIVFLHAMPPNII